MTKTQLEARLFVATALLFLLPSGLAAQTLSLSFEPPELQVSPICVARASDESLIAQWGAWDGITLPQRDVSLINRDIRRLAEINPIMWDKTIQRVITLLPSASKSFTSEHATLARIDQMIATGQLQELKAEGLVQKLLERGDKNSPKILNALAGFLDEGIGTERDSKRAAELLMAAGYGGNADALLTLSRLAVTGSAPEGWDVSPELAVTMAFGSLVGQVDSLICDRIGRIAREFSSGEVVTTDHDLALRWYRFAADLGDPIAAWRVAEYELQSELVTKDNDVLITYLSKASDGNLPYAQVALGRLYEVGALIPIDLSKARELYEAAANSGDRAGLVRLSGFLEAHLSNDPESKAAFVDTLDRLARIENPPPWVFAKLASGVAADEGRWAADAKIRKLLETGAALYDPAAIMMLSQINLGAAQTEAEFYATVDTLIHAVINLGEAAPTADIYGAYMCKAPNAPMVDQAVYWAAAEAAIGSSSVKFTAPELMQLANTPDPLTMAALQTQALYGRATPLANLIAVLERNGARESTVAFWTSYADRFANVDTARASLALDQATTPVARVAALDLLRKANAAGDPEAALKLAKALLADLNETARAEALTLLEPLARHGNGEAMSLLPTAAPVTYRTERIVFNVFAQSIQKRGDFAALLLALPFLTDETDQTAYRSRAITAMRCDFPDALAFADAVAAMGDWSEARRWLSIADQLVGQDAWQIVALGDSFRDLPGDGNKATALAYYEKAYALGNRTAVLRLLRIHGNPGISGYNEERAVDLYADLIALSDPSEVPNLLDDVARKNKALRRAVEARLDLDQLYADAAAAGNAAAMREHARRLQVKAISVKDLEASTQWLIRASEGGDAPAMVMLAQAFSLGVGVPVSIENARGWLVKAAAAGDVAAIDMVKLFTVGEGTN